MMPIKHIALILVLSAGTIDAWGSETALAAVPVPSTATVTPVTLNLLQNGHRLSIARLEPDSPIESVLQFYRDQWQEPLGEDIPGYIENTVGEWSIISRPHAGWNQVVQLRPAAEGLEGRISVLQLEPDAAGLPAIAMPGNATLVSSTGAEDLGHKSSTYVVFSESGVRSAADFYRRHFDNEGWSRVSDSEINNAQVMLLQRAGERAELVVSRMSSGGTLIIINKVVNNG